MRGVAHALGVATHKCTMGLGRCREQEEHDIRVVIVFGTVVTGSCWSCRNMAWWYPLLNCGGGRAASDC